MKFSSTTVLAMLLAAGAPIASQCWSLGPSPYFRTMVLSPSVRSIMRDQQAMIDRSFKHSSPRYEITDDDTKFQVAVDVPGVKMEDIEVTIDDHDGQMLSISGKRDATREGYSFSSKFSQSFSLDPTVDLDKFSANLENGVLIVTAPKNVKQMEEKVRRIPITANVQQLEAGTNVQVTADDTNDKKEGDDSILDLDVENKAEEKVEDVLTA